MTANNVGSTAHNAVDLNAAITAVRNSIFALQAKIDAETDPVKKVELIAEMKKITAEIGFVFDGQKEAAAEAVKQVKEDAKKTEQLEEEIMQDNKPSFWARFKAYIAVKWNRSSQFVSEHKVAVSIGAAAAVVAAVGIYASRTGNVNLNRGFSEASIETTTIETNGTDVNIDAGQPSIFQRMGGAVINGVVATKDLAVRGAIAAKDLAVTAAHKVGDFFTKKADTPYTVSADVAVA